MVMLSTNFMKHKNGGLNQFPEDGVDLQLSSAILTSENSSAKWPFEAITV